MLDREKKIIIKYCFSAGVSAILLAKHFGKSRQTITNVSHEETDFSGINAGEAFDLGTRAEKLAQSLKLQATKEFPGLEPSPPIQSDTSVTPLHMFRLKKLRERQEKRELKRLIFRRMLASLNMSTKDSSSDLQEEEVVEEPFMEDHIHALELAGQVLKNMQENLQKKDKRGWRYNKDIVDLGYMISRRSQAAYEMLRQVLPMPSRQTLTSAFGEMEQTLSAGLQDIGMLHKLLENYFQRAPLARADEQLQCTLAIDAFSINIFTEYAVSVREAAKGLEGKQQQTEVLAAIKKAQSRIEKQGAVDVEQLQQQDGPQRFNNCFLVVLVPFRWDRPHLVLSLFPAKSGSANEDIVSRIFQLIAVCSSYNINIRTIATDGDRGYSGLHTAVSNRWLGKRHQSFETLLVEFQRVRNIPYRLPEGTTQKLSAIPIADPLHALKVARSRVLKRVVFLTPSASVSQNDFRAFDKESWYKDRSPLARMSDYYALMMFSPRVLKQVIEDENYNAAAYLWGWTALMLVIRVPYLSIETRQALIISSFHVLITFLNTILDEKFKKMHVTTRFLEGSIGVTFFEPYYLIRVIHLLFALYIELSTGGGCLRMSAFGTHVNENLIGRARVGAAGINSFPVFLRHFAKTEISRLLEHVHGISNLVRTRDNIGGTKLDLHQIKQLEALDIGAVTASFMQAFEKSDESNMRLNLAKIGDFLDDVINREGEVLRLYEPNRAANSGIMARLISFDSSKQ